MAAGEGVVGGETGAAAQPTGLATFPPGSAGAATTGPPTGSILATLADESTASRTTAKELYLMRLETGVGLPRMAVVEIITGGPFL